MHKRTCIECGIAYDAPTGDQSSLRCPEHRAIYDKEKNRQYKLKAREKTREKVRAESRFQGAGRTSRERRHQSSDDLKSRLKRGEISVSRDSAPWFPGWQGCYPPDATDLDIRLLESGKGKFDPDKRYQTHPSDEWDDIKKGA